MPDSIFDLIAARLEEVSTLDKLEARGTLRIALKAAGLEPARVTAEQMVVALQRALPKELASRGIADSEAICAEIAESARDWIPKGEEPGGDLPEDVLRRLGRDAPEK